MKQLIKAAVIYALVCLILVIIWFHKGLLVAFGESEIPFYNPGYVVHFYGHPWSPTSLGFFPGTTLSLTPFFVIASFLTNIPLPPVIVESIFFFLFAFLGMIGGYLLLTTLLEINEKQKFIISLIGGFFYTLNFVCLLLAFNRLEYPFTIFYLGMPYGLLTFILGIRKRQLRYIIYFNLALLFFVGGFGGLPFMEIAWYFFATFVFYFIILSKNKKKDILYSFSFIFLCFSLWIVMNLWWLTSSIIFAFFMPHPAYSIKGNIGTFDILSEWQGNLSYLFRLMNKHYLESMIPTWGTIFFSPLYTILSYSIPMLAFFPLLVKKKPYIIYYFLGLVLLILFFTKGSEGPFGEIFGFLFSHLFFLEVFRNSFEKIGILLPVAYTPLVGYSLWIIFKWIYARKKISAYVFITSMTVILCGILVFPYWNAWVFTYNQPPANDPNVGEYVQVPKYYDDANAYINADPSDTRIIALPMSGEGFTSNWIHPYNGVEYTNGLFQKSAISYSTIMPYLENIAGQMNYTFLREPQSTAKIMQLLNAKYLMLRSDVDYKSRLMSNPDIFTALAKKNVLSGLTRTKTFGKLQFFQINSDPQKIFIAGTQVAAPSTVFFTDVFSLTNYSPKQTILTLHDRPQTDKFASTHANEIIFEPSFKIDYSRYPTVSFHDAEGVIPPYYSFLPGSKLFFLEKAKEKIVRFFTLDSEDKMFYDTGLLNRRFGELQTVVFRRDKKGIIDSVQTTKDSLTEMEHSADAEYGTDIQNNIDFYRRSMLVNEQVLINLLNTVPDAYIQQLLLPLKHQYDDLEIQTAVRSKYDRDYVNEKTKRIAYGFTLPSEGIYTFVIKEEDYPLYYSQNTQTWTVFVNNEEYQIQPTIKNGWFNFGQLHLPKGHNEIHLFIPVAKNLISEDTTSPKILVANKYDKEQKLTLPLSHFDPFSPYTITFSYSLTMAGGPTIEADNEFDAPRAEDGKIYPEWSAQLPGTLVHNKFSWNNFYNVIYPQNTASKQSIAFDVKQVNSCQSDNQLNTFNLQRCSSDEAFYNSFNKPTKLEVKNIKVQRLFSNTALLVQERQVAPLPSHPADISYKKTDTSTYVISVKQATAPFLLVFSETYYPEWKAQYSDGKYIPENNHILVNNYANAWYITKKGDYTITLGFTPARIAYIGSLISIPVILACLGFVLWRLWRK